MRKGKVTSPGIKIEDTSRTDLANLMVGREVIFRIDKKEQEPGEVVLAVNDIHAENNKGLKALNGVTLNVRAGEIVGLAGRCREWAARTSRRDHWSAQGDRGTDYHRWRRYH